jgi:hypothetical protein
LTHLVRPPAEHTTGSQARASRQHRVNCDAPVSRTGRVDPGLLQLGGLCPDLGVDLDLT